MTGEGEGTSIHRMNDVNVVRRGLVRYVGYYYDQTQYRVVYMRPRWTRRGALRRAYRAYRKTVVSR